MPSSFPPTLEQSFNELWEWCRNRDFSGQDPFDALNSRLFQKLPLRDSRAARLAWTQLVKRSPFNLRGIGNVPAEKNSKGIALFALAALARHRRSKSATTEGNARKLINSLLAMQVHGQSGVAWAYNFDWQSRFFFAAKETPTIVPTAFAARALIEAYESFGDTQLWETARSTCNFILRDLPRTLNTETELCFSYAPQTQTRVFNASLLAAEILMAVGSRTGEDELVNSALRATSYVVNRQQANGSWSYGEDQNQKWIDNFHTAFVLSSLVRINRYLGAAARSEFRTAVDRGDEYWRTCFFLADGWPKYYDDALYPADAHAAATAIVTLCDLAAAESTSRLAEERLALAKRVAHWAINNLRDSEGYFYYQRRRFFTLRTPYMRWSQAWMSYALARLLEESCSDEGVEG